MKLTISQAALSTALSRGGIVAPKNPTVPILASLMLTAGGDVLTVASTDLDRFAEAEVQTSVEASGATTVNAANFVALINRYPKDGTVSLELDGAVLIVKCGRSRVRLPTLPVDTFPEWANKRPEATFTMPADLLASLFSRARAGCGADQFVKKLALGGVFVEPADGHLWFVGSDGNMISIVSKEMPEGAADAPPMIVPLQLIDAAQRVFKTGDVTITASRNMVGLESEDTRLVSKLLEGPYPIPYKMAFGVRSDRKLVFDRAEFVSAMQRAVLTTEEGAYSALVVAPRDDGLELKTMTSLGSETREVVEAEMSEDFAPFGVNPAYMSAILASAPGDTVTIEHAEKSRYLVYVEGDGSFMGAVASCLINRAMAE